MSSSKLHIRVDDIFPIESSFTKDRMVTIPRPIHKNETIPKGPTLCIRAHQVYFGSTVLSPKINP